MMRARRPDHFLTLEIDYSVHGSLAKETKSRVGKELKVQSSLEWSKRVLDTAIPAGCIH